MRSSPDNIQRLRKGDVVMIPILAVHMLKSLWGEDAEEFK